MRSSSPSPREAEFSAPILAKLARAAFALDMSGLRFLGSSEGRGSNLSLDLVAVSLIR